MQNTYTNMKGELIFIIKTIQKILNYGDTRLLISDKRQQYVHWMALALIAVLASPMLHWQSVCRWFQMRFMPNESLHVYIVKIMLLVFSYMAQKTTMSHSLSFCPPLGPTRLVSGQQFRRIAAFMWTPMNSDLISVVHKANTINLACSSNTKPFFQFFIKQCHAGMTVIQWIMTIFK